MSRDDFQFDDDAAFEQTLRQAVQTRPEPMPPANLAQIAMARAKEQSTAPVIALTRTRQWWIAATVAACAAVLLVAAAVLYVPLKNGSFDVFWTSNSSDSDSAITTDTTTATGSMTSQSASSASYTVDGKLIGGAVLLIAIVAAALQTAVGARDIEPILLARASLTHQGS